MYPIHPRGHGRKTSYVQFGKRYLQDDYMIPIDGYNSNIQILPKQEQAEKASLAPVQNRYKSFINWLLRVVNIGPFYTVNDNLPLFTWIVIGFTVIIFCGELLLNKENSGEFFELEPMNYMLGPSIEVLVQVGARFPPCMRHVDSMPTGQRYVCLDTMSSLTPAAAAAETARLNNETLPQFGTLSLLEQVSDTRLFNSTCTLSTICGMAAFHQRGVPDQTYRLLTPLFIHTGIIHLCLNMLVLYFFGTRIEKSINSIWVLVLFIGSGVFGHTLGANVSPPTMPFLGCSSSLFGFIGYFYIDLIVSWKNLPTPRMSYFIKLCVCTALSFALGLLPGVDTFSHIGGLAAGLLLGITMLPTKEQNKKRKWFIVFVKVTSFAVYCVLLGILIYEFSINKLDKICPYCRRISCLITTRFCD